MNKLAEMRRVAEAATQGEWRRETGDKGDRITYNPSNGSKHGADQWVYLGTYLGRLGVNEYWSRDAAHIATFNPATVLRLLDALDRYQRGMESIRKFCEHCNNPCGETCECSTDMSLIAERTIDQADRILEGE